MPFLPVVYVPDKPSVSRPLDGEVKDRTFPDLISPDMLAIGGTVMGLVFIGLSALYFCGYGLDVDSKTGRFSIKPYATGR